MNTAFYYICVLGRFLKLHLYPKGLDHWFLNTDFKLISTKKEVVCVTLTNLTVHTKMNKEN